jgi:hypothetical protein
MVNWIVTINRPEYLEKSEILVPRDKITELLTNILDNKDWSSSASITVEPSNMEYFDG